LEVTDLGFTAAAHLGFLHALAGVFQSFRVEVEQVDFR
jgi:hypothetical protein